MGLTKRLHITISRNEADSYYQYSERLQAYLRQEADTEQFAKYCFLSNKTDAPTVLQKMGAVIRAADSRSSPDAATAHANEATTEFPVSLALDAMEAFHFPFRYVLDRELLRAGETNEPRQFLGEEAYEVLGRLAEKLAKADPRIVRVLYASPGRLFPEDTQPESGTAVENPTGVEPASTAVSQQVQVSYDRSLHCLPIHDAVPDKAICGVSFMILFSHQFSVTTMDSEPAGAEEMNEQLKVSFTPDLGFCFHPSREDLQWQLVDYELLIEQPNSWMTRQAIDRADFESFMGENAKRFSPDPSLQSASYSLVEVRNLILTDARHPPETPARDTRKGDAAGLPSS